MDWIYGAWTYRSFFNREAAVGRLEDILIGNS
jgi:hypothetical protein